MHPAKPRSDILHLVPRAFALSVLLVLAGPCALAQTQYTMLQANGQVISGDSLRDWADAGRNPSVGGARLFDASNPVRLLRRSGVEAQLRAPFVRFDNGDVLAGRVIGYEAGLDGSDAAAVLAVRVEEPLAGVDGRNRVRVVRVWADRVTSVVLDESAVATGEAAGGRVRYRDGRELGVEALRWMDGGVRALAGDQVVLASFDELAAIVPPRPASDADRVATLQQVPGVRPDDRVATVLLADGSSLSFAVPQMQFRTIRSEDRRTESEVWHRVQPVWSAELLEYVIAGVAVWSFRRGDQVPLSVLPVELIYQRGATGFNWRWRLNQSVRGQMLASGSLASPHGLGMHASSALAFSLPSDSVSVEGLVGIDQAVGTGGCARAAIHFDDRARVAGQPAWRSDFLIGGQEPARFGPLDRGRANRVILVVDDAHRDRPPGADPFDIRDEVDWLSPLLSLGEIKPDLATIVPELAGWQVEGNLIVSRVYDARTSQWRPSLHTDKAGVTLRRSVRIGSGVAALDLITATAERGQGHALRLSIDGQDRTSTANTDQINIQNNAHEPVHTRFRLDDLMGQDVQLMLRITQPREQASRDHAGVVLHQLALRPALADRPGGRALRPEVPLTSLEPINVQLRDEDKLIPDATPEGLPIEMYGQTWERGFAVRSGSTIAYDINAAHKRFVAVFGLVSGDQVDQVQIRIDDREAVRIGRHDRSMLLQQVDLAIPDGARQLELRVGRGNGVAAWVEAGFLRE